MVQLGPASPASASLGLSGVVLTARTQQPECGPSPNPPSPQRGGRRLSNLL